MGNTVGVKQQARTISSKYTTTTRSRRNSAATSSTTTSIRVSASRRSNPDVAYVADNEGPKCMKVLFELEPLDLKIYRNLCEGSVKEVESLAVWATIPRANNGRSTKALVVDRHQLIFSKREQTKVAAELKHHVHLAVRYCQRAQLNPEWASRLSYIPKVQELQHPNLVRLYGHFTHMRVLHVLTEYSQQGNLSTVLDRDARHTRLHHQRLAMFDGENAIKSRIRDLCHAVLFMHENQLAHTRLHPENVLVEDDGSLLVGDFKDAVYVGMENELQVPTPPERHGYAAPETYQQFDDTTEVDLQMADAWSVGILAFLILTRQELFRAASALDSDFRDFRDLGFSEYVARWKITSKQPHLVLPEAIVELLVGLLQVDPATRWSIATAVESIDWLEPRPELAPMLPSRELHPRDGEATNVTRSIGVTGT